jgi:hypothetical protein
VPGEVKLKYLALHVVVESPKPAEAWNILPVLVMVDVVDMLIGNWVSYPTNGLKRGKISMVCQLE